MKIKVFIYIYKLLNPNMVLNFKIIVGKIIFYAPQFYITEISGWSHRASMHTQRIHITRLQATQTTFIQSITNFSKNYVC